MTADAYRQVIAAEPRDRLDMFLATANRLGTLVGNVEKDFWVCWTLDVLYHRLPAGGPRLLFKGGTSLSKAYGLIRRFSEDIDVTVFRDDLNDAYVRPAVRIESGAKSALDPNRPALISPYVADDAPWLELAVPGITTIEPGRTFWDKVVIAHGLRRWYERRGVLRQEGQRISRHYYDLHCLLGTEAGQAALSDGGLAADCVGHARIFFNRPDFDLESAEPGSFALAPVGGMVDALRRDYENMATMIFGTAPRFDIILTSVETLDARINQGPG